MTYNYSCITIYGGFAKSVSTKFRKPQLTYYTFRLNSQSKF